MKRIKLINLITFLICPTLHPIRRYWIILHLDGKTLNKLYAIVWSNSPESLTLWEDTTGGCCESARPGAGGQCRTGLCPAWRPALTGNTASSSLPSSGRSVLDTFNGLRGKATHLDVTWGCSGAPAGEVWPDIPDGLSEFWPGGRCWHLNQRHLGEWKLANGTKICGIQDDTFDSTIQYGSFYKASFESGQVPQRLLKGTSDMVSTKKQWGRKVLSQVPI